MARRIVEVFDPCKHGRSEKHCADHPELAGLWHAEYWGFPPEGKCRPCPGGERRVLEPGSYVLVEKRGSIWPKYANDALYRWATTEMTVGADDLWDALAGGEQP